MPTARSGLIGRNVFPGMVTESGDLIILAVQRLGMDLSPDETTLQAGDTLLLQTAPGFMRAHRNSPDFYLTTEGGQYPYVWKVEEDGSESAVYFPDPGTHTPGISFWDLYVTY